MPNIKLNEVKKTYVVGENRIDALAGINLEINQGEFVIIVGPSGSGKTTLLNLLGGMDVSTSGDIIIDEVNISKFKQRQLTLYRRNDIGFVFQFYNLMPNLTALENVEIAVEICKNPLEPKDILLEVGLEDRLNNFPAQLSGGEQQRVSIARSIAKNAKLILCDEPTGALDYKTGKQILKLLHTICKNHGKTVVLVTHNSALKDMADKIVTMRCGLADEVVLNKNPVSIDDIEW